MTTLCPLSIPLGRCPPSLLYSLAPLFFSSSLTVGLVGLFVFPLRPALWCSPTLPAGVLPGPQCPFCVGEKKASLPPGRCGLRAAAFLPDPISFTSSSSHSPDTATWKGQNGRTLKVGNFPASAVTLADLGGSPVTHPAHRGSPARGEKLRGGTDG